MYTIVFGTVLSLSLNTEFRSVYNHFLFTMRPPLVIFFHQKLYFVLNLVNNIYLITAAVNLIK